MKSLFGLFKRNRTEERMRELNSTLIEKNKKLHSEFSEIKEIRSLVEENRKLADENDELERMIKDLNNEIQELIYPSNKSLANQNI